MDTSKTFLEAGAHRRSLDRRFRAWLQLIRSHARFWCILRSAFGLDFGSVEYVVGTEASIGQRLRAVAEGIGQRVAAFVGDTESLIFLHEVELDEAGLANDRVALHIAADADMAG